MSLNEIRARIPIPEIHQNPQKALEQHATALVAEVMQKAPTTALGQALAVESRGVRAVVPTFREVQAVAGAAAVSATQAEQKGHAEVNHGRPSVTRVGG